MDVFSLSTQKIEYFVTESLTGSLITDNQAFQNRHSFRDKFLLHSSHISPKLVMSLEEFHLALSLEKDACLFFYYYFIFKAILWPESLLPHPKE